MARPSRSRGRQNHAIPDVARSTDSLRGPRHQPGGPNSLQDRRACAARDDDAVADYAETLVDAARWQRSVTANLAPSLTHGSLEQRIGRLFERPRRSLVRLAAAITTTVFAGVLAAGVPAVSPASDPPVDSGRVLQSPAPKTKSSATSNTGIEDTPTNLAPAEEPQPEPSPQPAVPSPPQPEPSLTRPEPEPRPEPQTSQSEPAPQLNSEPSSQPAPIEDPSFDPEPEQRTSYRDKPIESQEIDEQIVTRNVIKIQDQKIRNVIKIRTP